MDKEEFDSLLFGNGMNMTSLPNDNRLHSTPDSGYFEEQTVLSNDTDFESMPTSPFSSHFSNSPSSESGIEEGDDEFDEKSMGSMDVSRDDFFTAVTESLFQAPVSAPMDINMQTVPEQQKTESSVAAAYEELKQLIYTVGPSSPKTTPSSSMKTIMSETLGNTLSSTTLPVSLPISASIQSSIAGVVNAPVSTVVSDTSTAIQPSIQDALVTSLTDDANLASALNSFEEAKSNCAPRCAKKVNNEKEKPKLLIIDEPEEVYYIYKYANVFK